MHSADNHSLTVTTDVLVIGAGVAGLSFALKMAENRPVILVAKSELEQTNTAMAQGGVASVMASDDDFANHIKDTQVAGAGMCQAHIVEKVVGDGPRLIAELEHWGVVFDHNSVGKDLNREGGHSHRRILHVQDHTGLAIQKALMARAIEHPNIRILTHHIGLDLITQHQVSPGQTAPNRCLGAQFLDISQHSFVSIFSPLTFLATGGAGKAFLYTSNWDGATGDGIAMAYRAGCRVSNMEFTQFHPTCLYHREARNFLITEALRGDGAKLVNEQGQDFTYNYHPDGPLAPRDIVARAIDAEMKRSGAECVFLDIRHRGRDFILQKYPFIHERCLKLGFDISTDLLPVVPAAHYMCGGVITDEHGQTDLLGLFAAGECANTGLHGANRLASNSLLECLAFADYAARFNLNESLPKVSTGQTVHPPQLKLVKESDDELILISHLWDEIRTCMWNYVGIVRSDKRLSRALTRISNIEGEINEYYRDFQIHPDIIELRNLAKVARLTVQCAIQRKHSVGTHYNVDRPTASNGEEPIFNICHP
jgi:L-aspartate oxidase